MDILTRVRERFIHYYCSKNPDRLYDILKIEIFAMIGCNFSIN